MHDKKSSGVVLAAFIAAALLSPAPAEAKHDTACQKLSTSGQRPGATACNPRQICLDATPGNPACNALSTSGQCAAVENFNPRQECLANMPPTPSVQVTGVEDGVAGGNKTYAGWVDAMRVRGPNVGMIGNTVSGESGLVVVPVPVPNCAPPDCLGVTVQSAPDATGKKRFTVRAAHGHSQSDGEVQIVTSPPASKFAAPFSNPAMYSPPIGVDHDRTHWNPTGYKRNGKTEMDCRNYFGKPFPGCYDEHEGTDFMLTGSFATMDAKALAKVTTVTAVAAGTVKIVAKGNFDRCFADPKQKDNINCQGDKPEDANFVDVQHDDGLVVRYFHLKKDSVTVKPDQKVSCGQALGLVGSSGRSSAPHLHVTVIRGAKFVKEKVDGKEIDVWKMEGGTLVDPYAEALWKSLDKRNVPNGKCG